MNEEESMVHFHSHTWCFPCLRQQCCARSENEKMMISPLRLWHMSHRWLSSSVWNHCMCSPNQTLKANNLQEKQGYKWYTKPTIFETTSTVGEHVTLTTILIALQVLPETKNWGQHSLRNSLCCNAIYLVAFPTLQCHSFNLLLVLLLPYIAELLCEGMLVSDGSWCICGQLLLHTSAMSIPSKKTIKCREYSTNKEKDRKRAIWAW